MQTEMPGRDNTGKLCSAYNNQMCILYRLLPRWGNEAVKASGKNIGEGHSHKARPSYTYVKLSSFSWTPFWFQNARL